MVHALKEVHRTLIPSAYLIDLRPVTDKPPVDVVIDDRIISAGFIDNTAGRDDDLMATQSIQHMVTDGHFERIKSTNFDLYTYWDTLEAFLTYMSQRAKSILPPETHDRLVKLHNQGINVHRIRLTHHMLITRYHKL